MVDRAIEQALGLTPKALKLRYGKWAPETVKPQNLEPIITPEAKL